MGHVKKYEKEVRDVLEISEQSRDSDYALYHLVLQNRGIDSNDMTGYDLLKQMDEGKFPSISTISRCRRKVQSDNPHLRGKIYQDRQRRADEVKKEVTAQE